MIPTRQVLAVILGGGRGTRLYPLTKHRAKPAVPIGGKHRLIDIPLSNCINSEIRRIHVLTQFLTASLHRHIAQTYHFDIFTQGWVRILAAEQTLEGAAWYQGTADAVRKQLDHIRYARPSEVLILAGDHLYRMDYRPFLAYHREKGADVTVAVHPVGREEAPSLGILKVDDDGRIQRFVEKPAPEALDGLESFRDPDHPYLGSMGIYIFRPQVLEDLLLGTDADDFGREILPLAIETYRVYAYPFEGYWADIGTLRAFYEANLALTRPDPPFDFYDPTFPIYTRPRFLPGTRVVDSSFHHVLVADGCHLERVEAEEVVFGLRSRVGPRVRLRRAVILGADFYETEEQREENRRLGRPDVGIGEGSVLEGVIVDKNARIGRGVVIRPQPPDREEETENWVIRDGIVVIPKNAVVPDGTVI